MDELDEETFEMEQIFYSKYRELTKVDFGLTREKYLADNYRTMRECWKELAQIYTKKGINQFK